MKVCRAMMWGCKNMFECKLVMCVEEGSGQRKSESKYYLCWFFTQTPHTHTHTHTHTHRNDSLGSTELASKLEPAFLCGLRCSQVQIRSRFFDVYNTSVQKRLFERLLYLMCSQNWEHCGGYFWIKHCLEVRV